MVESRLDLVLSIVRAQFEFPMLRAAHHAGAVMRQFQPIGNVFSQCPHNSEMAGMKNLTANQTEDAGLQSRDVCLISLTPPARNAGQAVASEDAFQSAHNLGLIL